MRKGLASLVPALAVVVLAACGGGGASQTTETTPSEPVAAQVCVEGEGRDAKLYIRNLNDYAWAGEIDFSVEKGGTMYTLLDEDRRSRSGKEKPTLWPPESQQTAQPFTEAGDFVWRDPKWGVDYNRGEMVERLRFFSGVTAARISIAQPHEAEWSADSVPACA